MFADPIAWVLVYFRLSIEHKIRCNKLEARFDTAVRERSVFVLSWVARLMVLFSFADCFGCCECFLTKMCLDFSCWGPRDECVFRRCFWTFVADFLSLNVQFAFYHFFRWIVLVV